MRKIVFCLMAMFMLLPDYYAKEIVKSKEAVKIKIEPAQPATLNIKLPYNKYFRVTGVKFELADIKQDLSGQFMLKMSNFKEDGELEEIKDKTWAVQEVVCPDVFELSRIEIKMANPVEDGMELLVCDKDFLEKARGVIRYDEEKKEGFVLLEPTLQIQKDEHIFLVVKLAGAPINVRNDSLERLFAMYSDYPDGFKERDPFPEFLRRDIAASKKTLVYKLYSKEILDLQPSFQVKINDSFSSFWTWKGEESIILKDKEVAESINMYFSENRSNWDDRGDITLPVVFTPEGATFPINLQLTSWELEIKSPDDYFMELKSSIEIIFKDNDEIKTNLISQVQSIRDSYKDDLMDEFKEKIKSFSDDVYMEKERSNTKGDVNQINGIMELTEELKSIF